MSLLPSGTWFQDRVEMLNQELEGTKDRIGRPWYQHFERVALRLIFRYPEAGRDQIEAALLHDVLMAGGKGKSHLRELGLSERAIRIIEITTPPPHGNHFRDFETITDADNAIYLDYIRGIVALRDIDAIQVKLADIRDTIDVLLVSSDPVLKGQLHNRYLPSLDLLSAAGETPMAGKG